MQLNCLILCQLHVKNTAAVSEGRVDCWKSIMLYWSLCSACLTAVKKLLNNIQRGFKELFLLLSPNIEPLLFCHLPWPKHFWGRQKLYCGKNSNIHTQTRINHTLRVSLLITSEQMFPLLGLSLPHHPPMIQLCCLGQSTAAVLLWGKVTEREMSSLLRGLARMTRSVRSTKHQFWLATTQDRGAPESPLNLQKVHFGRRSEQAVLNQPIHLCKMCPSQSVFKPSTPINVGDIKCYFNKYLTFTSFS